jgi:predicted RNase H-like HicB family nuclease
MPQRFYPAVLERGDNDVLGLWFPDFPDCAVASRSQEELMARASEALGEAMEAAAEQDAALPEPTSIADIRLPEGCDFISFVAIGATPPSRQSG